MENKIEDESILEKSLTYGKYKIREAFMKEVVKDWKSIADDCRERYLDLAKTIDEEADLESWAAKSPKRKDKVQSHLTKKINDDRTHAESQSKMLKAYKIMHETDIRNQIMFLKALGGGETEIEEWGKGSDKRRIEIQNDIMTRHELSKKVPVVVSPVTNIQAVKESVSSPDLNNFHFGEFSNGAGLDRMEEIVSKTKQDELEKVKKQFTALDQVFKSILLQMNNGHLDFLEWDDFTPNQKYAFASRIIANNEKSSKTDVKLFKEYVTILNREFRDSVDSIFIETWDSQNKQKKIGFVNNIINSLRNQKMEAKEKNLALNGAIVELNKIVAEKDRIITSQDNIINGEEELKREVIYLKDRIKEYKTKYENTFLQLTEVFAAFGDEIVYPFNEWDESSEEQQAKAVKSRISSFKAKQKVLKENRDTIKVAAFIRIITGDDALADSWKEKSEDEKINIFTDAAQLYHSKLKDLQDEIARQANIIKSNNEELKKYKDEIHLRDNADLVRIAELEKINKEQKAQLNEWDTILCNQCKVIKDLEDKSKEASNTITTLQNEVHDKSKEVEILKEANKELKESMVHIKELAFAVGLMTMSK